MPRIPEAVPERRLVERMRWFAGAVVLVAICFSQAPNRIVPDTKLDLVVDPGRFLARALHAWNPQAAFGELQNQAYGYLFPMGPFFWIGHAVHLSPWVVQRLWWSVLLVAAYAGFCRLAALMGLGNANSRLVGGLAFALAPRVLTELGSISVEALPMLLLPWVLVPLVVGARSGSTRRAAGLSGLAVACLGGVNAAATAAVLLMPALYLLSRGRGPRRRSLMGWWVLAVGLATAWWVLPLLVLGRYAYPFLSYIETARITTSVTSAPNVLRGTDHWLGFLVGSIGPQIPPGYTLATAVLPAAATVLVAGLGLAGLARPATPERRFLGWSLLAGAVLVGAGYAGAAGGLFSSGVQDGLDGALAPLRNVHKFDPLLRLPLALGLAVSLERVPVVARRLVGGMHGTDGRWLRGHPRVAPAGLVAVALVPLLLATSPAWTGKLANQGSFASIPTWWHETADWLAEQGDQGRALLEPASRFGNYRWGRPADEPLQALGRSPWAVLDAVPLGSPGATRLLDGFEDQLAGGVGSSDLASAFQRAGVRYVVVRNDLAVDALATPPAVVRAALVGSPGIELAASFGPLMSSSGRLRDAVGPVPPRPAVEIFAVGDRALPTAQLLTGTALGLSGGSEALAGSVPTAAGTPYVALADGGPSSTVLVTDTLRLRRRNMGSSAVNAYGDTQPAGTDTSAGQPAGDVLAYGGAAHQSTARLVGARSVTASSTASDPLSSGYLGPSHDSYAAVDGDSTTSWVARRGDPAPSWRIDFGRPVAVRGLSLDFGDLPKTVSAPVRVTVQTSAGRWTGAVTGDRVSVGLAAGTTSTVTISLGSSPGLRSGQVGLTEVEGLPPVARTIVVPADSAGAGHGSRWGFARQPGARRACIATDPGWACVPSASPGQSLQVAGPEPGPVDRTFTSGTDVDAELEVTVVPRQGPDLNRVLDTALGASVTGSSVLVDDAAARPGAALDGDPGTAWLPADSDAVPRLAIGLPEATSVTGVQVTAPRKTLDRVAEVVVASPDGARHGVLSSSGSLNFAPLQARQFSVTFRLRADGGDADSPAFQEVALVGAHPHGSGIVQLECGSGPVVTIDGQSWQTGVSARASELVAGAPVDARVCATGQVHLPAGTHRLVASSTPALDVAAASLTTGPPAPGVAVPLEVPHWSSQGGTVQLTAGGGVLALVQGFNAGWQAEVDGHRLTSIRLDGWRQAWLVPRGVSGLAAVRFEPDKAHREGLALGALALLALLLLVGLPARKSALAASPAVQPSAVGRLLVPLLAAAILAGPAGVLAGLAGVWLANKGAVRVVLCGSVFLAVLVAIEAARPFGPWWVFALAQLVTVGLLAAATSSPAGVTRGEP